MKKIIFIIPLLYSACLFAQVKNIVIITLDGYRWQEVFKGAEAGLMNNKEFNTQNTETLKKKYWHNDASERRKMVMPFLWTHVLKNGQIYGNRDLGSGVNVSNPYWFSYPGYSEIFSGFVDTSINSNKYPDNPNANVLEFINKQPGFKNKVAAFSSWVALESILNEKRSGFLVNAGYEDLPGNNLTESQKMLNANQHRYSLPLFVKTLRLGSSTYDIAKQYMKQNHPRVTYIGFGDTDHFAHDGQYDFYLDAANKADGMIEDLWNFVQSDKFYKNSTAFLITVDHGRGLAAKWTSHGKKAPNSDEIWFAVFGAGVKPLGEMKGHEQLWQKQFASTISHMLGLKYTNSKPVGESISSVTGEK